MIILRFLIFAALLSVRADAAGPVIEIDPDNTLITRKLTKLDVHTVGRVQLTPLPNTLPAGAQSFTHQWPGVYFEASFRGKEVFLKFDDAANDYRLLIDHRAPITIARPGKVELKVSNLPLGDHLLRLEKVGESSSARGSFQGFYTSGSRGKPVPRSRPQIEFIGDSAMSGFGNRSETRECSPEQVRLTTDTHSAFPALMAKKHGADYQVNAISGAGVVRNYAGSVPDRTLPRVYPFTFFDRSASYSDPKWSPRIIMIKLEADFAAPLKAGERWTSHAELAREFSSKYGRFIAQLHRRHPDAAFILWWFDRDLAHDVSGALLVDGMQQKIEASARAAGVQQIHFLPMKLRNLERTACASHYSLRDHKALADYFSEFVNRNGLWSRPTPRPRGEQMP
jgi:hypothetical protein